LSYRNSEFGLKDTQSATPSKELLVFWWSPQHDWQAVNVLAKTGRRIAGAPESWVTRDGVGGTVEHLAARGPSDELLVFFWTPAHDWQAVDVTAIVGRHIVVVYTRRQSRREPEFARDRLAVCAKRSRSRSGFALAIALLILTASR